MSKIKQGFDGLAKVAVIGDSSVGKTNIILRYVSIDYHMSHISTIGIDFKVKSVNLDGFKLKLQIWDTAGQQRFRNLTGTVYQGAQAIILVYSITDRKSYENIQKWMNDVHNYTPPTIIKAIAGNKADLDSSRIVSKDQGQLLAKKYNALFYETSAKDNINIQKLFESVAIKVKSNIQIKKHKINQLQSPKGSNNIKYNEENKLKKQPVRITNQKTNEKIKKKNCQC